MTLHPPTLVASLCLVLAARPLVAEAPPAAPARAPIQVVPGRVPWAEAPPSMPAGTRIAVLEGDPKAPGLFTLRLEIPAGFRLAPHWHPQDERVTVLSGSLSVGFGETFDPTKGTAFPAGSFYVNPTPLPHYVWSDGGAVIQITGLGPWEVKLLHGASGI